MPTLVLAGGTSASLGRAIVTAVLSSEKTKHWNTVILSRSRRTPLWLQAVDPKGARSTVKDVDYRSVDSLLPALKGADTLVSVTSATDGTQAQIQINLLRAAVLAGCRRFAPAQWQMGIKGYAAGLVKSTFEGVWEECVKYQDRIECGRFNCGMFMNYFGYGIYPEGCPTEQEIGLDAFVAGGGYAAGADTALEGLLPQGDIKDGSGGFLISLRGRFAELPAKADGSWPRFTTTTLRDVGRFVAASLELPRWEVNMSMAGDTLTMGDLLRLAEDATGEKFDIQKLLPSDIEAALAKAQPDDFMKILWGELKLLFTKDEEDLAVLRPVVNRLCPEVRPITVKEYIQARYTSNS